MRAGWFKKHTVIPTIRWLWPYHTLIAGNLQAGQQKSMTILLTKHLESLAFELQIFIFLFKKRKAIPQRKMYWGYIFVDCTAWSLCLSSYCHRRNSVLIGWSQFFWHYQRQMCWEFQKLSLSLSGGQIFCISFQKVMFSIKCCFFKNMKLEVQWEDIVHQWNGSHCVYADVASIPASNENSKQAKMESCHVTLGSSFQIKMSN